MVEGLIEGKIVHFVMPNGQHRPAIIVKVWDWFTGCCNLQVFTDGMNDDENTYLGLVWKSAVLFDNVQKKANTWHWMEQTTTPVNCE